MTAAIAGYGDVGRAYGMAFQIRDDVAGIWSTLDETGKTAGSDIARRKWTFPVVWAIAQPPSAARSAVVEAYARGSVLDAPAVRRVVEALDELGAREAATQTAAEHVGVIERHRNRELREFLAGTLGLAARMRTPRRRPASNRSPPGRCPRSCWSHSSSGCSSSITRASRPTSIPTSRGHSH